jgi:hypothetical protein
MTTLTLLASLCCIFFAIGLCFAPNAILAGLLILAATCLFLTSIALAERGAGGGDESNLEIPPSNHRHAIGLDACGCGASNGARAKRYAMPLGACKSNSRTAAARNLRCRHRQSNLHGCR